MRSLRQPDQGFTLIELLVVVALIAIVAGLAAPAAFRSMDGLRARTAARELAGRLRLTRSQAAATRRPLILAFSDEGQEYAVWAQDDTRRLFIPPDEFERQDRIRDHGGDDYEDPGSYGRLPFDPSENPPLSRHPLAEDVTLLAFEFPEGEDNEERFIDFDPQGYCSGGTIVIGNEDTAYAIEVARVAGQIHIERRVDY